MWIIIILLSLIVIYVIYTHMTFKKQHQSQEKYEKTDNSCLKRPISNRKQTLFPKEILPNVNTILSEAKFHNDYRDVNTAIANISSDHRKKFNKEAKPIDKTNMIHDRQTRVYVQNFIDLINSEIDKLNKYLDMSIDRWDNQLPQKKVENGWDKLQVQLGLPSSLYSDPAENDHIHLLKIMSANKFDIINGDETRFKATFIVYKKNVVDQMIITLTMMYKNTNPDNVYIEDIYVDGYLTLDTNPNKMDISWNKMNQFNGITDNNVLIDEAIRLIQS